MRASNWLALAAIVFVLLLWLVFEIPAQRACHKRDGVWLSREWACVAPPPPVRQ